MGKKDMLFIGVSMLIASILLTQFTNKSHHSEEHTTTQATTQAITQVTTQATEPVAEVLTEKATISTVRTVTTEEYQLLLRVCMSECGGKWGESLEGKVAVVETVLNRVDMGYGTISEVILAENQYSTGNNGEPDETVVEAVNIALQGDMYPDNMIYFRTNHYHTFGTPYKKIGDHYFSLEK